MPSASYSHVPELPDARVHGLFPTPYWLGIVGNEVVASTVCVWLTEYESMLTGTATPVAAIVASTPVSAPPKRSTKIDEGRNCVNVELVLPICCNRLA